MNSKTNVHWTFSKEKKIATGTFSVVYRSAVSGTGDVVGVKKLRQNKKYKNRELAILKEM